MPHNTPCPLKTSRPIKKIKKRLLGANTGEKNTFPFCGGGVCQFIIFGGVFPSGQPKGRPERREGAVEHFLNGK